IPDASTLLRIIPAGEDWGREASFRLAAAKFDGAGGQDPAARLTGTVPYQKLAGDGAGLFSLRLTGLVGGAPKGAYHPLGWSPLPTWKGRRCRVNRDH